MGISDAILTHPMGHTGLPTGNWSHWSVFQHFLGISYSATFSFSFLCHNFRPSSAVITEYFPLRSISFCKLF